MVTLGLVADDGFVPPDSELFISSKSVQGLNHEHRDSRSVAARRYRCVRHQSKPQVVISMLKKALRMGLRHRIWQPIRGMEPSASSTLRWS